MTMHYHGVPVSGPRENLLALAGRNFCVSYATAPHLVDGCHGIGQSVMLDNGAFTFWKRGPGSPDWDWDGFYNWVEPWLAYRTTWAVIPDVIDGDEDENDQLISEWPFGVRGAPVWHLNESLERLSLLAHWWPRVCIGSSGDYATVGNDRWHWRMIEVMNHLCDDGPPPCWLHMLRGMSVVDAGYPFASVDSTDVGQNHHRVQNTPVKMADRWDALQAPGRWVTKPTQAELLA